MRAFVSYPTWKTSTFKKMKTHIAITVVDLSPESTLFTIPQTRTISLTASRGGRGVLRWDSPWWALALQGLMPFGDLSVSVKIGPFFILFLVLKPTHTHLTNTVQLTLAQCWGGGGTNPLCSQKLCIT